MKPRALLVLSFVLPLIVSSTASAQLIVNPADVLGQGQFAIEPALLISEIEYDEDQGNGGDIERTALAVSAAHGVTEKLDIYGEFGYTLEAEADDISGDGDGFIFGAGIRGLMYQADVISFRGVLGGRYIDEDYGSGVDGNLFEIYGTTLVHADLNNSFSLYGGLDIIPFSDGELEFGSFDSDIERDNFLGIRFGANYRIDSMLLRAEAAVIGQQTLILSAGFRL